MLFVWILCSIAYSTFLLSNINSYSIVIIGLSEKRQRYLLNDTPSPFIIFIINERPFNAFDFPEAFGPINSAPLRISLLYTFVFPRIEYLDAVKSISVRSLNERKFVRYILASIMFSSLLYILHTIFYASTLNALFLLIKSNFFTLV